MVWVRKDLFEKVVISFVYNVGKLAKSETQKPCRMLHLMRDAKRCLSSAEVNPHQSLAA